MFDNLQRLVATKNLETLTGIDSRDFESPFSFYPKICDIMRNFRERTRENFENKKPQLKKNQLKFVCFKYTGNKSAK
jgi:hypothetical protein